MKREETIKQFSVTTHRSILIKSRTKLFFMWSKSSWVECGTDRFQLNISTQSYAFCPRRRHELVNQCRQMLPINKFVRKRTQMRNAQTNPHRYFVVRTELFIFVPTKCTCFQCCKCWIYNTHALNKNRLRTRNVIECFCICIFVFYRCEVY